MSAQRAKVRSCTVTARVLSPDEARARRTYWVIAAWGLVWAFATLPVVRAGLAGGGVIPTDGFEEFGFAFGSLFRREHI